MICGSLNVIGSHRLTESDTLRRCGFVKVGMALLKEVCHCGDGLGNFLFSEYCPETAAREISICVLN